MVEIDFLYYNNKYEGMISTISAYVGTYEPNHHTNHVVALCNLFCMDYKLQVIQTPVAMNG